MSKELVNLIRKNFQKRKKEAKRLLDEGIVNKDELIESIRAKRKETAKKTKKYTYHHDVTQNDMIVILAIRLNKQNI